MAPAEPFPEWGMALFSSGFALSHKGLEMKGWDPQNNWKIRADGAGKQEGRRN